jgi:hypothetical protein
MKVEDGPAALGRWLKLPARSDLQIEIVEQELAEVERRYAVRLPNDFRAGLKRVGPGVEEIWDDESNLWWPSGRLRNLPDEYAHGSTNPVVARAAGEYIFFADHLIWCWAWAICCGEGKNRGKVAVIGTSSDAFVADSFSDFVARYLADPMSIMP